MVDSDRGPFRQSTGRLGALGTSEHRGLVEEPFAHSELLDRVCARLFGSGTGPQRLARYQLAERIGAGASGVLWRAWDPLLRRDVAIKVSHAQAETAARVRREARILAVLSHPGIVRIFDVGQWQEYSAQGVYLVEEYLPGGDLAKWLAERARSAEEIISMFCSAASSLAAAHRAGVLHRDFKPANVVLGTDGVPRLCDFGLARRHARRVESTGAASGETELQLSTAGARSGTPLYMAPEQHAGDAVDARADQFAVCATLFEALYGRPPFAGSTEEELAVAKRAGSIDRTSETRRGTARVRQVLERGLSFEPGDRWPDLNALVRALRGASPTRARQVKRTAMGLGAGGLLWTALAPGPAEPCRVGLPLDEYWTQWQAGRPLLDETRDSGASQPRFVVELDQLVTRWDAARAGICEAATQVGGSPTTADANCLDRTFAGVRAVLAVVDSHALPDPSLSVVAAAAIADPMTCLAPAGTGTEERDLALVTLLSQARLMSSVGQMESALVLVDEALLAAAASGDQALLAEALFERADFRAREGSGLDDDTLEEFQRVYFMASSVGEYATAAAAAERLAVYFATSLSDAARGRLWVRHGGAALAHAGMPRREGLLLADASAIVEKIAGAMEVARQIRAWIRVSCAVTPCEDSSWLRFMVNECAFFFDALERERALSSCREAVAFGEVHGLAHTDTHVSALINVAKSSIDQEEYDEIDAIADDILARVEMRGDRRAAVLRSHAFELRARSAENRGDLDAAIAALKQAQAATGTSERLDPEFSGILSRLGFIQLRRGEYSAAAAQFVRLQELDAATRGETSLRFAVDLMFEGLARLEAGEMDLAVDRLERGVRGLEAFDYPAGLAVGRFHLARALVASEGDRARALELARLAERGIIDDGKPSKIWAPLDVVQAWIADQEVSVRRHAVGLRARSEAP